ncbi:MAG: hypothetical protein RI957_2174 [Verrucomicrobiota bacterium]|jgi:hypothetical protein
MKSHASPEKSTSSFIRGSAFANAAVSLMTLGAFVSPVLGATVAYVSLPSVNGSSSIPTSTSYTSNLGYAFKTGSSGTFDIDWINLELTSGAASGSGTFKIALHATDNETAYSAVASSTAYATDTVSFTTPATSNTPFVLELNATLLSNISGYSLQGNTAYALFVYNATGSAVALRRLQGLADGTTNNAYTVTNGFTMLDTFRNNGPNYSNSPGSYPAFAISFGTTEAIPEPSALALLSVFVGCGLVRRHRSNR